MRQKAAEMRNEKREVEKKKLKKWTKKVIMIVYTDNDSKEKNVISTSWSFNTSLLSNFNSWLQIR